MRISVYLCLFVDLTGCVAPEAPTPAPRAAVSRPAISTAGFEDAPLPNRKMGAPAGDSIVRMAR